MSDRMVRAEQVVAPRPPASPPAFPCSPDGTAGPPNRSGPAGAQDSGAVAVYAEVGRVPRESRALLGPARHGDDPVAAAGAPALTTAEPERIRALAALMIRAVTESPDAR